MPSDARVSDKMKNLIRLMLVPNPSSRPKIKYILNILSRWNETDHIPLSVKYIFITFVKAEAQ